MHSTSPTSPNRFKSFTVLDSISQGTQLLSAAPAASLSTPYKVLFIVASFFAIVALGFYTFYLSPHQFKNQEIGRLFNCR